MDSTNPNFASRAVQKTQEWCNQIMAITGRQDSQKAYLCLRAVLHVLRDRLPLEEAVQFGAQLPMLVRGFYYEGWNPARTRGQASACTAGPYGRGAPPAGPA